LCLAACVLVLFMMHEYHEMEKVLAFVRPLSSASIFWCSRFCWASP